MRIECLQLMLIMRINDVVYIYEIQSDNCFALYTVILKKCSFVSCDCFQVSRPIYMSVKGVVFDVSSGRGILLVFVL